MRRQTAGTAQVLEEESCQVRLSPDELPARVSYSGAARAGTAPQIAIDFSVANSHWLPRTETFTASVPFPAGACNGTEAAE